MAGWLGTASSDSLGNNLDHVNTSQVKNYGAKFATGSWQLPEQALHRATAVLPR